MARKPPPATSPDKPPDTPSGNRPLVELYRTMRRIRCFEERVGEMFVRGASAGSMLHLSIGEEGVAGICAAMAAGDSFTTHHRGHGIFLARGGAPARMFAEIAGKRTGYCAGKGGSMHIADMAVGHLGANAIVGGGIPHIVGAGLTYTLKATGQVALAFFGDGAMQQGILYEAMNLAALWSLPVVFVCVNNRYGMGTRIDRAAASTAFDERARAFGLDAASLDGADVEAVHAAARGMIDNARAGRPGFLSMSCYRFFGHARMDKSPYRDAEEERQGRARDPLALAHTALSDRGEASGDELAGIDRAAAEEMDAALEDALAQPFPPPESLFSDVYDADQPQPVPLRARLTAILAES